MQTPLEISVAITRRDGARRLETGEYVGYASEVLNPLAYLANFTYSVRFTNSSGNFDVVTGKWNEALGMLQRGTVDLIASPVSSNPLRARDFHFATPHVSHGEQTLAVISKGEFYLTDVYNWFRAFYVLDAEIWQASFVAFFLLVALSTLAHYEHSHKYQIALAQADRYTRLLFQRETQPILYQNRALILLDLSWSLLCLVLVSSVSARLATTMTLQEAEAQPFSDAESLFATEYSFGAGIDGKYWNSFAGMIDDLDRKGSTDAWYMREVLERRWVWLGNALRISNGCR